MGLVGAGLAVVLHLEAAVCKAEPLRADPSANSWLGASSQAIAMMAICIGGALVLSDLNLACFMLKTNAGLAGR